MRVSLKNMPKWVIWLSLQYMDDKLFSPFHIAQPQGEGSDEKNSRVYLFET